MGAHEEMVAVKEGRERELLDLPNVVGVAVGPRQVEGESSDEPAILVLVERKVPRAELADEERVPGQIEGIRTDVIETGRFVPNQEDWTRHRPMNPGTGIGVSYPDGRAAWGTLGCFVLDSSNYLYALTNNHVVCFPPNDTSGVALQPSVHVGGDPRADRIGWIDKVVPLQAGGAQNWADMGSVAIEQPEICTSTHPVVNGPLRGNYNGVGWNWQLWKVGARTGYTQGRVEATNATFDIPYKSFGTVRLVDQVLIKGDTDSPSLEGDSGSVWVTMDHYAAALNFAASPGYAVANHISTVLNTWSVGIWAGASRSGELVEGEVAEADGVIEPDPRAVEDLRERTVRVEAPAEAR